jgi:rRNA maturation RNase YbeY
MPTKENIHFFFQNVSIRLSDRKKLKAFTNVIFQKEGKRLESLNYIFCSDKYLLKINQSYLGHDFYTDIITFNLSKLSKNIEGEVYISFDRVKENARKLKILPKQELLRVIFHGILHLCSYNDKTLVQQKKMRRKEDELIALYSKFHVKRQ